MVVAALIAAAVLSANAGGEPLRMVLTPYRAPEDLITRYRPLAERLAATAGRRVEVLVAADFGSAADMLLDGRADFGELTPYAFVSGMQRGKLQALAADAMVGRPGTGLIITRTGSRISTLEQLKGKSFGFVDRFSSTGFLGPWANLQSKGFDPATLEVPLRRPAPRRGPRHPPQHRRTDAAQHGPASLVAATARRAGPAAARAVAAPLTGRFCSTRRRRRCASSRRLTAKRPRVDAPVRVHRLPAPVSRARYRSAS